VPRSVMRHLDWKCATKGLGAGAFVDYSSGVRGEALN